MSKYDKNVTREAVLETYKQLAQAHFQREAENPEHSSEERPNPPAPIPQHIVTNYQITDEEMKDVRQSALYELFEDKRQSDSNKLIYMKWYGNLYAPPAPILDFAEAIPPKEPLAPDMNHVAESFALEEAAMTPPPSTPPPPLSTISMSNSSLGFSSTTVDDQQTKKGLFGRIKDWLKDKFSMHLDPSSQDAALGRSSIHTVSDAALKNAESIAVNLRSVVENKNPNTAKGSNQGIMSAQKKRELQDTKSTRKP